MPAGSFQYEGAATVLLSLPSWCQNSSPCPYKHESLHITEEMLKLLVSATALFQSWNLHQPVNWHPASNWLDIPFLCAPRPHFFPFKVSSSSFPHSPPLSSQIQSSQDVPEQQIISFLFIVPLWVFWNLWWWLRLNVSIYGLRVVFIQHGKWMGGVRIAGWADRQTFVNCGM